MKKMVFNDFRNFTTWGRIRSKDPWHRIKILGNDGTACILTWNPEEKYTEGEKIEF